MFPAGYQQTRTGDQQVTRHPTPNCRITPSGELCGEDARTLTGAFQIIFGIIEVILGIIILVGLPMALLDYGLEIFCGVSAVTAGCVGLLSKLYKRMIIAYMVLSIIAAVLCGMCIFIRITNFASELVVISSLVVLFQGIVSIIGASVTCGALSSTNATDSVQVMQQHRQQPSAPPITDLPPPYTVVTAYPSITRSSYVEPSPTYLDAK